MEPLHDRFWRMLVRLYGILWPIAVHHSWTAMGATLLLQLPRESAGVSLRLFQITDSHISEDPLDAGERFHAERMHNAFRTASSLWNGSQIQPATAFRDLVDLAAASGADVAALTGDIVNFPQQRAVAWVAQTLNGSLRTTGGVHGEGDGAGIAKSWPIPFVYTSGNHDWFYEGSDASQWELRRRWRQRDLQPLYARSVAARAAGDGVDFGAVELNGALLLTIDNSLQQVTAAQLAFFRAQVLRWRPTVLLLHIPLSVSPTLRPFRGFALCGDPAWGEASDRSWRDERRKPWPRRGNSPVTELFLAAVQAAAAPNGPLVAVLSGHVHAHDATPFGEASQGHGGSAASGAVQYITLPALGAGFRLVDIQTLRPGVAVDDRDELDALVRARQASVEFVDGLSFYLTESVAARLARACWRNAPAGDVGVVDVRLVDAAVDTMLRRTEVAMREGFQRLAHALRPLLQHGSPAHCGEQAMATLSAALSEWADPSGLIYRPGEALELGHGRSIYVPLVKAISALRRPPGSWTKFGEHVAGLMWATAGVEDPLDEGGEEAGAPQEEPAPRDGGGAPAPGGEAEAAVGTEFMDDMFEDIEDEPGIGPKILIDYDDEGVGNHGEASDGENDPDDEEEDDGEDDEEAAAAGEGIISQASGEAGWKCWRLS